MPGLMVDQLQNPTNVILLVILLYLAYPILASMAAPPSKIPTSHLEAYSWMPASHPDSIVWKEYTPRTLRPYDGTQDNMPILFAIRGKVYDVSSGRSFYGPGGPYGKLRRSESLAAHQLIQAFPQATSPAEMLAEDWCVECICRILTKLK
jgi:predicted heme/steroid binding protein